LNKMLIINKKKINNYQMARKKRKKKKMFQKIYKMIQKNNKMPLN